MTDPADHCAGCGGIYRYDTSIPSPLWNIVIRAAGGPEYLCAACIIRAFVKARLGFTAVLSGDGFEGVEISVSLLDPTSAIAGALKALVDDNNALRRELHEIRTRPDPLTLKPEERCDRCDDAQAKACFMYGCQRYDRHDTMRTRMAPVCPVTQQVCREPACMADCARSRPAPPPLAEDFTTSPPGCLRNAYFEGRCARGTLGCEIDHPDPDPDALDPDPTRVIDTQALRERALRRETEQRLGAVPHDQLLVTRLIVPNLGAPDLPRQLERCDNDGINHVFPDGRGKPCWCGQLPGIGHDGSVIDH